MGGLFPRAWGCPDQRAAFSTRRGLATRRFQENSSRCTSEQMFRPIRLLEARDCSIHFLRSVIAMAGRDALSMPIEMDQNGFRQAESS